MRCAFGTCQREGNAIRIYIPNPPASFWFCCHWHAIGWHIEEGAVTMTRPHDDQLTEVRIFVGNLLAELGHRHA